MAEQITSMLQLRKDRRASRFTLLFLEYNEFLLNDLAVYKYDAPTPELSWVRCMEARVAGRLKLCTRGLVFEPTSDSRAPIVRFPFKAMTLPLSPFPLSPGSAAATGIDPATLFAFTSKLCIDVETGGRVAPFVTHEFKPHPRSFVFQLQHSTVVEFLLLACELQRIEGQRSAFTDPRGLLRPIIANRMAGGSGIIPGMGGIGGGGNGGGGLMRLVGDNNNSGGGGLVPEDAVPAFELRHLVDFSEKLLMANPVRVDRIRPLLRSPGVLMVTNREIYFQPSEVNNTGEHTAEHWPLRRLRQLVARRHMLRHTGLELCLDDGQSTAFFNFESPKERDAVLAVLMRQPGVSSACQKAGDLRRALAAWQKQEMSNFEYLAFLNTCSGRSVHDLTQYPVFPWVLKDYDSSKLDLDGKHPESTFRDLSKPMGALDPGRLEYFRERYESMPPEDKELGMPPPFMYGSHYSTPGFVLYYLVRAAPQHMLSLQSGKFDAADRMFHSVKHTWQSCLTNPADVKELTPEFYTGDGSFLVNENDLPLGTTQDGETLHHVKLPPWAKSPRDFVRKCRKALDCDYVSAHLHEWIDLVFGHKQRGKEADDADNVFYYLTYEGAVDLEEINDPNKRAAYESQINEFGQCPTQLFKSPHPTRFASAVSKKPNTAAAADLWLASERLPPSGVSGGSSGNAGIDKYANAFDKGHHGGASSSTHLSSMPVEAGGGAAGTAGNPSASAATAAATHDAAPTAHGMVGTTTSGLDPGGRALADGTGQGESGSGGGGIGGRGSRGSLEGVFSSIGGRVTGLFDRVNKARADSNDSAGGCGCGASENDGLGGCNGSSSSSSSYGPGGGRLLSKPAPPPKQTRAAALAATAAASASQPLQPSAPPPPPGASAAAAASRATSTSTPISSTGSFAAAVERERGAPLPPPPSIDDELDAIINEFAPTQTTKKTTSVPAAAPSPPPLPPVAAVATAKMAVPQATTPDVSRSSRINQGVTMSENSPPVYHHSLLDEGLDLRLVPSSSSSSLGADNLRRSSPDNSGGDVGVSGGDLGGDGGGNTDRVSEASSSGTTDDEGEEQREGAAVTASTTAGAPSLESQKLEEKKAEEEKEQPSLKKMSCVALSALVRNHRDAITSVALAASDSSFLCASTSRDGSLRVTPLASFPPAAVTATTSSGAVGAAASPSNPPPQRTLSSALPEAASSSNALSRRRLFQASDLALSCCSLVEMAGTGDVGVVCGSWDNTLFLYSVNSACVLGQRIPAHDDSLSCVDAGVVVGNAAATQNSSSGSSGGSGSGGGEISGSGGPVGMAADGGGVGVVVSGSWDASVKVWLLKRGRARSSSTPSSLVAAAGGGEAKVPPLQQQAFVGLDPSPLLELFDHEEQVQCVGLEPTEGRLVVSGSDDGRVVVSDISHAVAMASSSSSGGRRGSDTGPVEPLAVVELSELLSSGGGGGGGGGGGPCGVTAVSWASSGDGKKCGVQGGHGGGGERPRLFVSSKDGFVRELSVGINHPGACLAAVPCHLLPGGAVSVPLSLAASHSFVVCAGEGGFLRVWAWGSSGSSSSGSGSNTAPFLLESKERAHEGDSGVLSIGLQRDLLVTASETTLRLWSLVSGE